MVTIIEIKLTKDTAIANVLRQMMVISKENMDTKMEYLKKVLNEYESDGLDLREHVGAFGIREITDKKSKGEKEAIEDSLQILINKSVKSVGKAINDMEKQIQDHFPDIKYIVLEIN